MKRRLPLILIMWLTLAQTKPVGAHVSGLQAGDAWWWAWHFDSLVVASLSALAMGYGMGLKRIWQKSGAGRVIPFWRAGAFALATLALAIALLSPLDTLGNDLAWVHMVQHSVLMVIAAPLMAAGSPGYVSLWALPKRARKWVGRFAATITNGSRPVLHFLLWNAGFIWLLHAAGLWVWHLPPLYQGALTDQWIHDLEHMTFFVAAFLFWRLVLDGRHRPTLNPGLSVLYLFTTSIQTMMLGVMMTLSPKAWYPIYDGRSQAWGLSPLQDQQVAGAIMWMPAGLAYAIVAAILFGVWVQQMESAGTSLRIGNS
jgi:putative membrane protein